MRRVRTVSSSWRLRATRSRSNCVSPMRTIDFFFGAFFAGFLAGFFAGFLAGFFLPGLLVGAAQQGLSGTLIVSVQPVISCFAIFAAKALITRSVIAKVTDLPSSSIVGRPIGNASLQGRANLGHGRGGRP